jgi:hypothetical protein
MPSGRTAAAESVRRSSEPIRGFARIDTDDRSPLGPRPMSRPLTANDPLYDAFLRDVLERSEIAACAELALGALGDDLPHAPLPAGLRERIAAGLSTTGRLDRFADRVAGLSDIQPARAALRARKRARSLARERVRLSISHIAPREPYGACRSQQHCSSASARRRRLRVLAAAAARASSSFAAVGDCRQRGVAHARRKPAGPCSSPWQTQQALSVRVASVRRARSHVPPLGAATSSASCQRRECRRGWRARRQRQAPTAATPAAERRNGR